MTEFENMVQNFIKLYKDEISELTSKGIINKSGQLIFVCKDCNTRFGHYLEELKTATLVKKKRKVSKKK